MSKKTYSIDKEDSTSRSANAFVSFSC